MAPERCPIRPARPEDAAALIGMMRALAAFEGYLPRFRVTARDLRIRAFGGAPDPDWEHWRLTLPEVETDD
jgi:diamine N-acetyltransferase